MTVPAERTPGPHSDAPPTVRLLFAADHFGYADGVIHGATTWYLNVLPRLQARGVEVTACFLGQPHPASSELSDQGVETIFLGRSRWDPRALGDLLRLIRARNANIVHAAGMKGILLGRITARLRGVALLTHFHDANPTGPVIRWLLRRTGDWEGRAITVSEAVASYAAGTLGCHAERIRVLRNGIDTERLSAASPSDRAQVRGELGIPADAPVIGVVGRFAPEKGHEPLLEALPELLARIPAARLLLAGDGDRRAACEEVVDRLGLRAAVHFAGFRSDIPAVLQAVDVVLVPSLMEGLPFSALEAMAAGRPVVAFAVGGLPEIVHDGETGLLAPPGDYPALFAAIGQVLGDEVLREKLVRGGRQLAAGMSVEKHVAALLAEYHRLCGTPDAPGTRA